MRDFGLFTDAIGGNTGAAAELVSSLLEKPFFRELLSSAGGWLSSNGSSLLSSDAGSSLSTLLSSF